MLETAIRTTELEKTYGEGPTRVAALDGVDLEIAAGELVVLLGPSGSGKTTLLNLVGALEPPTHGAITVAGHDLGGLDEDGRTAFRRDAVGFVFQFFNLVPTLTARENVELVLELTGRDRAPARATDALEAVGLADRLDHFPAALSGGEQQRVAIARAVAKDPAVLLCDEPTGALDLDTGRRVLEVLRRINRDAGRTVLMVTHNSAIAAMADRVVRLRSGRIVADDVVDEPAEPAAVSW
jgi:putative ABC transport system ATP-binding protein